MNVLKLRESGRYEEALSRYQEMLSADPNNGEALDGLPHVYLALSRLEEALDGFLKANARAKLKQVGQKYPYLMHVGVVNWLLGRHDKAIETLRESVDGVLDGTIEFADASGGTKQGLLLWYMGVTVKDLDAQNRAISYLKNRSQSKQIENWPGPIALFVTGQITRRKLLRREFLTENDWLLDLRARLNSTARIRLAWARFYFGISDRSDGNEDGCLFWLKKSTKFRINDPILEWHLARAEVEKAQGS